MTRVLPKLLSKNIATIAACGALCDSSLFSLEIAVTQTDIYWCMNKDQYVPDKPGVVSLLRCRLTSIGIPMFSPTILSLTWESPHLEKMVFILRRGPGSSSQTTTRGVPVARQRRWCSACQSGRPVQHESYYLIRPMKNMLLQMLPQEEEIRINAKQESIGQVRLGGFVRNYFSVRIILNSTGSCKLPR